MRYSQTPRNLPFIFSATLVCVLAFMTACTNTAPPSIVSNNGVPPRAGQGGNPVLDQSVTFAVKIPPVPAAAKAAIWRRPLASSAATPTPQPTSLYLSPHTGSVTIALVAVNGLSLANPAPAVPPVNVPTSCAPAGCTVTVSGVPAANGVNLFAVVTYTGTGGSGSIISSGVVDVSVPTSTTQTIGGASSTTLTLGGFVASISLTVTPTKYVQGIASSGSVVVSAKDATGATIIGNAQYANPIILGFSTTSTVLHFSFPGGASTYAVTMPLSSPIPLKYDGASSSVTSVTATSVNGNGATVSATPVPLTISIGPPPSPSPTPTSSPTKPPHGLSLYVLNSTNNAVLEYPSPAPSATPKRSFGPTLALLACSPGAVPYAVGMVQGLAMDSAGNAYVSNNPNCNTSVLPPFTTWQFAPAATASSAPSASYAASAVAYSIAASQNLGYDPSSNNVLMPVSDAITGTPAVLRVAFAGSSGSLASVLGGGACVPLIGFMSCDGVNQYSFQSVYSVAVDSRGYTYFGGGVDLGGNSVILVFAPGATSPLVYSAIGGPPTDTQLDIFPAGIAIDGTTLYVLNAPSGNGLSNCGSLDSPTNVCVDGNEHEYVTAYDTTKLAAGKEVDLKPIFVLGGDTTGHFGSTSSSGLAQALAQRIAANNGTLYVSNASGPVCDSTCAGNAASGIAPPPGEVDIYSVTGLTGSHTNVAPVVVLKDPKVVPAGVAIGPSGTGTGALIRAPVGVPGKFRAHMGKRLQQIH